MKAICPKLKLMFLRPAVYSGEELEIEVQFKNASLYRTDVIVANTIDMKPGDTASIGGKIYLGDNESSYEYITIYMDEQLLSEFINKFGFNKITATVEMKVKFIYATYSNEEFCNEEKKEIIAFKLLEILSYQDENSTIKSNISPEIRDYFTDGMK